MADITHGAWIKDGKAVDKVFNNSVQVYGRNLLTGTAKFTFPFSDKGGTHTVQKYDDETNYIQYTSNTPLDILGFFLD